MKLMLQTNEDGNVAIIEVATIRIQEKDKEGFYWLEITATDGRYVQARVSYLEQVQNVMQKLFNDNRAVLHVVAYSFLR